MYAEPSPNWRMGVCKIIHNLINKSAYMYQTFFLDHGGGVENQMMDSSVGVCLNRVWPVFFNSSVIFQVNTWAEFDVSEVMLNVWHGHVSDTCQLTEYKWQKCVCVRGDDDIEGCFLTISSVDKFKLLVTFAGSFPWQRELNLCVDWHIIIKTLLRCDHKHVCRSWTPINGKLAALCIRLHPGIPSDHHVRTCRCIHTPAARWQTLWLSSLSFSEPCLRWRKMVWYETGGTQTKTHGYRRRRSTATVSCRREQRWHHGGDLSVRDYSGRRRLQPPDVSQLHHYAQRRRLDERVKALNNTRVSSQIGCTLTKWNISLL